MTTHPLVSSFYERVWNSGDRAALDELVTEDFRFQGSLGPAIVGRDACWQIVTMVRTALSGYHCAIEACVSEETQAFAKMRFPARMSAHSAALRRQGWTWPGPVQRSSSSMVRASAKSGCLAIRPRWMRRLARTPPPEPYPAAFTSSAASSRTARRPISTISTTIGIAAALMQSMAKRKSPVASDSRPTT